MGEQTVVADGEAKAGDQPEAEEQAELRHADRTVEQQAQRNQRADKGQNVENDKMPPLHLVKMPAANDAVIAFLWHGRDSRAVSMSTYKPGGRNPSRSPRFQQGQKPVEWAV